MYMNRKYYINTKCTLYQNHKNLHDQILLNFEHIIEQIHNSVTNYNALCLFLAMHLLQNIFKLKVFHDKYTL